MKSHTIWVNVSLLLRLLKELKQMVEGTVKFYNFNKRFGFIAGDDGKDYFVHESGIESKGIKDGVRVTFEAITDERGPKAVKVKTM